MQTTTNEPRAENIVTALSDEIARVHEIDALYEREVGPAGMFARAMMRASITRARAALNTGDVIAIIAALRDLQGYDA